MLELIGFVSMIVLTTVIFYWLLNELSILIVYGVWNRFELSYLIHELKDAVTNPHNQNILSSNKGFFTKHSGFSVFSYYYYNIRVNDKPCRIPRWYPLHKMIKAKFKELNSK